MPPAAVPVTLTAAERKTLKKRARGAKTPYRDRFRAQIVLAATGSQSPLRFDARPVDDPRVRRPDILRAVRLLGWTPAVPIEDGIRRTVEYFRREVPREALRR